MAKKRSIREAQAGTSRTRCTAIRGALPRADPGGKGGRVKNRKQAIAIGLSKARKKGKKVPRKR